MHFFRNKWWSKVVAKKYGQLFYAFCICESSSRRRQLAASFFLCLPFSSASLWSGLFFPLSPLPLPPSFVSKNRHSLRERAREPARLQLHSQKLPEFDWGQWEFEGPGEKRSLFFWKKRKNLVENKQDLFFPSVLQGKKITIKLSNRQVVFTIQRGKNCLTLS